MEKLKNLKPLIIEPSDLKKMDYSAQEYLDRLKTMNVCAGDGESWGFDQWKAFSGTW